MLFEALNIENWGGHIGSTIGVGTLMLTNVLNFTDHGSSSRTEGSNK